MATQTSTVTAQSATKRLAKVCSIQKRRDTTTAITTTSSSRVVRVADADGGDTTATTPALEQRVQTAIDLSTKHAFSIQKPDGHWTSEVLADATFTSEYVFFRQSMGLPLTTAEAAALIRWLLSQQQADGSWSLAPETPGNLSTSVEAYLALKILGLSPSEDAKQENGGVGGGGGGAMRKARDWILAEGGIARVRFFTRLFLASFGLFPWKAVPQLPPELILMPKESPVNIYTLSSWARSTLIPILIVRHHEPVYALPNGSSSAENDFLDEIWLDPTDKMIAYAPPLMDLFAEGKWVKLGFTVVDQVLAACERAGLTKSTPLRSVARKACLKWILEHQEVNGDWAGFWPPVHGSVWALLLEGYTLDCREVVLGMEQMENLSISDDGGKRIQATVSPVWDTVLMLYALCDAGFQQDQGVVKAVHWVQDHQLHGPEGDWRVYRPQIPTGGWSFEYVNNWYPDVDDSAVAVMALLKHDPMLAYSSCLQNAMAWILGMQNPDGGWGAFDWNNDKLFLNQIPFSDMDSLCDPSTSDVTGRILECLGLLLKSPRKKNTTNGVCENRLSPLKLPIFRDAAIRAIEFLLAHQESSGAWWGRWGANYIYGTSNVLRGLAYFAHNDCRVRAAVLRAVAWVKSVQNNDGGWGETVESYRRRELIGKGKSTPSQTAWGVMALLPYCTKSDRAIGRGIEYLLRTQIENAESGGSTWPVGLYTGTGFPNVLYLEYTMYQHYFPMAALSKFLQQRLIDRVDTSTATILKDHPDTDSIQRLLNESHVLIMALGSRGDVQPCLRIAQILRKEHGCRVRLATHPKFRKLIQSHDIEFHSVGGDPTFYANIEVTQTGFLPWIRAVSGAIEPIRRSICLMFRRFWTASIDLSLLDPMAVSKAYAKPEDEPKLAFVADIVISNIFAFAHVHCAEQLQVPLVFLDMVPLLPTRNFPYHAMCSGNQIPERAWYSLISYYGFELFTWLCLGRFINHVRVHEYGMSSLSTVWATYRVLAANITHIGLWSRHLVPRPADWGSNMIVVGSATSPAAPDSCRVPQCLRDFLKSDHDEKPVIAVSFGTYPVPTPQRTLSTIFRALELADIKAVFCGGGSADQVEGLSIDATRICMVEEVPHDWLLPQVKGFMHHGGAGHVAAGLKYGLPTLIMPLAHDQGYWTARVSALKIGPIAVDYKQMTAQSLATSLRDLLSSGYKQQAKLVGAEIAQESDGSEVAAAIVAQSIGISPLSSSSCDAQQNRCAVIPSLGAAWTHRETGLRVSLAAAACLVSQGVIAWEDLDLPAAYDWKAEWKRVRSQMPWVLVMVDRLAALAAFVFCVLGLKALTTRHRRPPQEEEEEEEEEGELSSKRVQVKIRQSEQAHKMLLPLLKQDAELQILSVWGNAQHASLLSKLQAESSA